MLDMILMIPEWIWWVLIPIVTYIFLFLIAFGGATMDAAGAVWYLMCVGVGGALFFGYLVALGIRLIWGPWWV